MTDRLHRSRVLPEGYQYGDARARPELKFTLGGTALATATAQFTRMYEHVFTPEQFKSGDVLRFTGLPMTRGWNVIEGDDDGA